MQWFFFASIQAGHLKTHLKMHSEEKSNKCNFASLLIQAIQDTFENTHRRKIKEIQAGDLKIHFETHTGEKSNKCNQCDYSASYAGDLRTHENAQWGKLKQMKPMKLHNLLAHSLWRHFKTQINKSKLCDNSCSPGGNLRRPISDQTYFHAGALIEDTKCKYTFKLREGAHKKGEQYGL